MISRARLKAITQSDCGGIGVWFFGIPCVVEYINSVSPFGANGQIEEPILVKITTGYRVAELIVAIWVIRVINTQDLQWILLYCLSIGTMNCNKP